MKPNRSYLPMLMKSPADMTFLEFCEAPNHMQQQRCQILPEVSSSSGRHFSYWVNLVTKEVVHCLKGHYEEVMANPKKFGVQKSKNLLGILELKKRLGDNIEQEIDDLDYELLNEVCYTQPWVRATLSNEKNSVGIDAKDLLDTRKALKIMDEKDVIQVPRLRYLNIHLITSSFSDYGGTEEVEGSAKIAKFIETGKIYTGTLQQFRETWEWSDYGESWEEDTWPKVKSGEAWDTKLPDGYTMTYAFNQERKPENFRLIIKVQYKGAEVGRAHFEMGDVVDRFGEVLSSYKKDEIWVGDKGIEFKKEHQRKGLGTEVYKFAERLTKKKAVRSGVFGDNTEKFWDRPDRGFGKEDGKDHWDWKKHRKIIRYFPGDEPEDFED